MALIICGFIATLLICLLANYFVYELGWSRASRYKNITEFFVIVLVLLWMIVYPTTLILLLIHRPRSWLLGTLFLLCLLGINFVHFMFWGINRSSDLAFFIHSMITLCYSLRLLFLTR